MSLKIGHYKIMRELGKGGMGTVYLGRDPRLERNVAVKILRQQFYQDGPEFSARFEREAKTVASLSHNYIVPIYEFGEDGQWHYFVMPYMVGGSLRDRLQRGAVSLEEATEIVERIGSALDKAHSKGIYHRDVKPGNILFDEDGHAYLSDFGVVKLAEVSETFTKTNVTLGTPHYMSPEQVDNINVDGRSDLYALGVILYEMLSGQKPYDHESQPRLLIMHLIEPIPDILEVKPDLPQEVANVIRRAMAKDPDERFQSGEEMSMAVRRAKASPKSATPVQRPIKQEPTKKKSNSGRIILILIVLGIVFFCTCWILLSFFSALSTGSF